MLLLAVWLGGCSEGDDTPPVDAGASDAFVAIDAASDAMTLDTGTSDAAPIDAPADAPPVADAGPAGLVVNEIRASGEDWIELYNAGSTAIELGGVRVADTNDMGLPKLDEAAVFPASYSLAPGAYFVIAADVAEPLVGLQTECFGLAAECLHAGYGISASRGETIWVVAADPSTDILAQAAFPPSAVADGQSYGRVPDGTGAFVATTPTPGASNVTAP